MTTSLSVSNITLKTSDESEFSGYAYFELEYKGEKENLGVEVIKRGTELENGDVEYKWDVNTNSFFSKEVFDPEDYSLLEDTVMVGPCDNEQRWEFRDLIKEKILSSLNV